MKDRYGCLSVRSKCHMLTANFTKQSAIEVVCVQNNEADLSSERGQAWVPVRALWLMHDQPQKTSSEHARSSNKDLLIMYHYFNPVGVLCMVLSKGEQQWS